MNSLHKQMVVIGGGVGGLSAAAILARAGVDVTVLEAQVYAGGCAGTYFHQGYRFDAGATLAAGFYPGGPMDLLAQAAGIASWPAAPARNAMQVHLPGGKSISRWVDDARWEEYRAAFGQEGLDFFRWQERTADHLWQLALRLPPWPAQSLRQAGQLIGTGLPWLLQSSLGAPALALDAFRPVAAHLPRTAQDLRLFVDAQLLISAQAGSEQANALYGAAALDLPRRGVAHLRGGMGAIADQLVQAVRAHGGRVLFRQEAVRIVRQRGQPVAVETAKGDSFPAGAVLVNLPPWNAADLLSDDLPAALRRLPPRPRDGWGAFMLYLGIDSSLVPPDFPLHHQVILRRPLGEGNTIFLSLSPEWDTGRAPQGARSVTLSTHTALQGWWELHENDRAGYEARKEAYKLAALQAAEQVLPGLRDGLRLVLPGTPVTFQRFTRRKWGWVGGFPQTSLLRAFPPRLGKNLWLVGDSIFPGQSTAAVALGGLRIAEMVKRSWNSA